MTHAPLTNGIPLNIAGAPLSPRELADLQKRWISPEIAAAAFLRHADTVTGAESVGRKANGSGDYSGILIPYLWPSDPSRIRGIRLRREHPDVSRDAFDRPNSDKVLKYLAAPGSANLLYLPPGATLAQLADLTLPIVLTEGEFKTLALWRLAFEKTQSPSFLPIGLSGVWNWKGAIGKTEDESGARVDIKGPIPDLEKIPFEHRVVTIVFDSDVTENPQVAAARSALTRYLATRGAIVQHFRFPKTDLKGIDDFLARHGPALVLSLLAKAKPATRAGLAIGSSPEGLLISEKGPLPNVANALTLLRTDPAWQGSIVFNEFSGDVEFVKSLPWSHGATGLLLPAPQRLQDWHATLTAEWLQHHHVNVPSKVAREALLASAREHPVHPPRQYLESLQWDGIPRIGSWLTTFLGVLPNQNNNPDEEKHQNEPYIKAVGSKWLISAVARIFQPGCKVDCCLILEGSRGLFKSSAIETMGNPWFSDQISQIGTKDSKMELQGVWIIEIGELAALSSAHVAAIKGFMSAKVEHYRPAYGISVIDQPRQCVFAGTHNPNGAGYIRDDAEGRRFWPVACGKIDLPKLRDSRDQLWAEAVCAFRAGIDWWLDDDTEAQAFTEQSLRQAIDPWEELILKYLTGQIPPQFSSPLSRTTINEIFADALHLEIPKRGDREARRVANILHRLGWRRCYRKQPKQKDDEAPKDGWAYYPLIDPSIQP